MYTGDRFGQSSGINSRQGQGFGIPFEAANIKKACSRGDAVIHLVFAGEFHQIYSFIPIKRDACKKVSGLSSLNHNSLHKGDIAWIGVPVC